MDIYLFVSSKIVSEMVVTLLNGDVFHVLVHSSHSNQCFYIAKQLYDLDLHGDLY